MFLTFNILNDLGFGESFKYLKSSSLHPWIGTIFNYFRIAVSIDLLRLYTVRSIDSILIKIAPKRSIELSNANYQ